MNARQFASAILLLVLFALGGVASSLVPMTTYPQAHYRIDGWALSCAATASNAAATGFNGTINGEPRMHARLEIDIAQGSAACFLFVVAVPPFAISFDGVASARALG